MNIDFKPTLKQHQAWKYLNDKTTNFILYGGSVGSGKSFLGCMWIIIGCLTNPGSRYLIGRSRLSTLKRTTLKTLFDILKENKLESLIEYNSQNQTIHFRNGSEILLIDLYPYPQDIDYDRLGSLEISGAFIDELSEISYKGFEVLFTRIRYKLNEFNITPKLFCASNPALGWPKDFFYQPYIEKNEKLNVKFIQSLPTDNPYLPKTYLDGLNMSLSSRLKQRLLLGEWDFDDDDYSLFKIDDIMECFFTSITPSDTTYISCDIANIGKDKTILTIWKGLEVINIEIMNQKTTPEIVSRILELKKIYKVMGKNIIIDSDGLGVGVADSIDLCYKFKGNSKAINGENYRNLKTQCIFQLSNLINNHMIKLPIKFKDEIVRELQAFKIESVEKEQIELESKSKMKQFLGKSPDYADTLYMRMVYEIKKSPTKIRII